MPVLLITQRVILVLYATTSRCVLAVVGATSLDSV